VEELKKNGMFITLVQFGFYAVFGLTEQQIHGNTERKYDLYKCLSLLN